MNKFQFYHFSDLDEKEFNECGNGTIRWIDEDWAEASSIEAIAAYFYVNEDEVMEFPELKIVCY